MDFQKSYNTSLKKLEILITLFNIQNNQKKFTFLEKIILITYLGLEVFYKILFLKFNFIKLFFSNLKLVQKKIITNKIFSRIKPVILIRKSDLIVTNFELKRKTLIVTIVNFANNNTNIYLF